MSDLRDRDDAAKVGKIPAKQARSQQTVERIEKAARALLQEQSWQDLTMAGLAKAAEAHVGSIYARFEGKAALLDHLDEVYSAEIIEMTSALLLAMDELSFETALTVFVDGIAKYHRKNSGLVRTLILETRTSDHPTFHARSKRMNNALRVICNRLMERGKAGGRAIAPDKMKWALFLILSTVREAVLFPAGVPRPSTSLSKQVEEITAMALGYLKH